MKISINQARLVSDALAGAVKSAEAKGEDTIGLADLLIGVDDAARVILEAAIGVAQKIDASGAKPAGA